MVDLTVTTLSDEIAQTSDLAAETIDGGGLSLREALAFTNANGLTNNIDFQIGLTGTMILTLGQLSIASDLTIDGDTNNDNAADITISGNNSSRIFNISGSLTDATLLSLTLTDGLGASQFGSTRGGAIHAISTSSLTIEDSSVLNSSADYGGGILTAYTDMTISNTLIAGNNAVRRGGAIYMSATNLSADNITIANNSANRESAIHSRNFTSATQTLTNSTIAGNSATGSIVATLGAAYSGIFAFENTVFANNSAGVVVSAGGGGTGPATAENSFFDGFGLGVTDLGGNIGLSTFGNNPMLGSLADNGGTTQTIPILAGSQLINAGSNALAVGIATDANGNARIQDGTVDIGATEFAVANLPAIANDDAVGPINENSILNGASSVFSDNGSGADSDPEGDLFLVTEVNGVAANVGNQFALASGALLLVNSDGTFSYDPNGSQDALPGPASGASNLTATDNFEYTITGGDMATVTVTIAGVDSDDMLLGTAGVDTLFGGVGHDTLFGGADNDTLHGQGGGDTLNGEAGDDRLIGGVGNDTLNGGDDNDRLYGQGGVDLLFGNGGNDFLYGQAGADRLDGGAGDDRLFVDSADSLIQGGTGFDTVYALAGQALNFNVTTANVEWVYGHSGADILNAATAITRVVLHGRGNDDQLTTGSGDDTQVGGTGNDTMNGGGGLDRLYGQTGMDTINGEAGDDQLYGQQDNDTLDAGAGRDFLFGGTGDDTLTGGGADLMRDLFVMQTGGDADTITDYEDGVDRIQFRSIAATTQFSDLTIANNGSGDAVVTYSEGTVTLTGIDSGLLDASDFNFI